MHSARTGYIYECVCTGYIYECIPHAHAHACIHARIHSYLGRFGSALSSERPPVLVLLRCFSSHPVLNRHLCFYVYVCVECNRDHHSEILRAGMHAPPASCQRKLNLSTKSRQREEAQTASSMEAKQILWLILVEFVQVISVGQPSTARENCPATRGPAGKWTQARAGERHRKTSEPRIQSWRRPAVARAGGGGAKRPTQREAPRARSRAVSVRTSAKGAGARSAGGGASASTSASGANARSAGGRASASTSAKGASARIAAMRRTCRCRPTWRSLRGQHMLLSKTCDLSHETHDK